MSQETSQNLKCPDCGNTQETKVWYSINVTNDPELKERLFKGEIDMFSCEKCGKKTFINAPLLYHDMTLKFLVQYYPPENLDDTAFFLKFKSDGSFVTTGMPRGWIKLTPYLTRPHIVFDIFEMLRYVVFRDRLAEMNGGMSEQSAAQDAKARR